MSESDQNGAAGKPNGVVVYLSTLCPYCLFAKRLLKKKGVPYTAINVDRDLGARQEMQDRSGRFTVPQIFIGSVHVGGFDDLEELEERGQLEPLLHDQGIGFGGE